MFKKFSVIVALLVVVTMMLAACQPPAVATEAPAPPPPTEAPAAPPVEAPVVAKKICQVTDMGGIDDKTFNQTAWKGVEDAIKELGIEGKYLESQQQTDYEKNINTFVEEKCDLIVTVGFLLGDATKAGAEANADQKFTIVDSSYDPQLPNVMGQSYAVDQPSFMAGYLAAGMSQTGKVGTYGGIQIPPLEPFMTGFFNGVQYYNKQKSANVEVLGWDPATKTGLFTGNFESLDDGRRMAETLMDEGADVIFPVAGPCGLGSAAAIQERGLMMIGVDTDMTVSAPEYTDILLTSVLKNMDKVVFEAAKMIVDDKFQGGTTYTANMSNGGVGLAAFNAFDAKVPAELKAELEQIGKEIADGKIDPMTAEEIAKIKVCQVTDMGGIDDKTFNQTAWKGVQDSVDKLGFEGKYLESQQQTDYEKNINTFVEEKCDLIVTVGFLLGDATKAGAEANADQKFTIVDSSYDPQLPNVMGQFYAVDQPSFMAGYLAAGMSQTGKVGTYGGIQIPPLEPFMTGFFNGVQYYNKQKSANVEVLGWDPATMTGLFTGNFESLDDGRRMAETLMDEGADVIFPVAGPCGLGSAAAIQERGLMMIGVDTDMTVSAPEYTDILLTSVLKNMDKVVFEAARVTARGNFPGGTTYTANMGNGGVGLAAFNAFDAKVSDELKGEIEQVGKDIAAGVIDPMAVVE